MKVLVDDIEEKVEEPKSEIVPPTPDKKTAWSNTEIILAVLVLIAAIAAFMYFNNSKKD